MVYLPDLRFGNKALNLTPKGQATKEKKKKKREREKQTHRHRVQTSGYCGEREGGRGKIVVEH